MLNWYKFHHLLDHTSQEAYRRLAREEEGEADEEESEEDEEESEADEEEEEEDREEIEEDEEEEERDEGEGAEGSEEREVEVVATQGYGSGVVSQVCTYSSIFILTEFAPPGRYNG